jgi:steroid 5-alpha reductase family enzyme
MSDAATDRCQTAAHGSCRAVPAPSTRLSDPVSGRGLGRSLGRAGSLALVAVAYLTALGIAWVAAEAVGADRPVWALAAGYVASALVIYVWSMAVDNGSMFDAWWSVLPPAAAVWLSVNATAEVPSLRIVLVMVVVWAWAIRLTSNWARDWPGLDHEDWRYLDLYGKGPKALMSLVGVHLGPCCIVLLGSLSLVPSLAEGTRAIGVLDWLALAVGLGAVGLAFVADEQMRSFARTKAPGQIMDRGLWRHSRHPNYLGEILFWCSLWIFGVSAAPSWWWTVIGPIAMISMFLGASIPMLDGRSAERRPAFAEYRARSRALLPLPVRRG